MIETKITKRILQRIGHVLRMKNNRMTKQIALGWPTDQTRQTKRKRQIRIEYWRKCLKDAGVEPDHMEQVVMNRRSWRPMVSERIEHMKNWEKKQAEREDTRRDQIDSGTNDCPVCNKILKNHLGMKNHMRKMHKLDREERNCPKCGLLTACQANLISHLKSCSGTVPRACGKCEKVISRSNLARHRKKCVEQQTATIAETQQTGVIYPCGICKTRVTANGWSIKCVDCFYWFHRRCTGMTISEMRILANYRWHCGCDIVQLGAAAAAAQL